MFRHFWRLQTLLKFGFRCLRKVKSLFKFFLQLQRVQPSPVGNKKESPLCHQQKKNQQQAFQKTTRIMSGWVFEWKIDILLMPALFWSRVGHLKPCSRWIANIDHRHQISVSLLNVNKGPFLFQLHIWGFSSNRLSQSTMTLIMLTHLDLARFVKKLSSPINSFSSYSRQQNWCMMKKRLLLIGSHWKLSITK